MKKIFALAALMGGMMMAAAPLPAVAETVVPAHCAILPLLKADCRAAIRASAEDMGSATVAATGTVTGAIADAVPDSIDNGWRCERTRGGKALFSCSR